MVLVYTLALVAALENYSWRSVGVRLYIVTAKSRTIHGELDACGLKYFKVFVQFAFRALVIESLLQESADSFYKIV